MKRTKLFTRLSLASAITILITAAGCKKNNDNGAGAAGINATVGSTAWQSQQAFGAEPSGDSFIFLTGYLKSGSDSSWFEVDISDTAHVNQPDNNFSGSTVYYGIGTSKIYSSDPFFYSHGSITVTSWDKAAHTIAGNFNGVFYNTQSSNDSIIVNNGHFNSSYVVQ